MKLNLEQLEAREVLTTRTWIAPMSQYPNGSWLAGAENPDNWAEGSPPEGGLNSNIIVTPGSANLLLAWDKLGTITIEAGYTGQVRTVTWYDLGTGGLELGGDLRMYGGTFYTNWDVMIDGGIRSTGTSRIIGETRTLPITTHDGTVIDNFPPPVITTSIISDIAGTLYFDSIWKNKGTVEIEDEANIAVVLDSKSGWNYGTIEALGSGTISHMMTNYGRIVVDGTGLTLTMTQPQGGSGVVSLKNGGNISFTGSITTPDATWGFAFGQIEIGLGSTFSAPAGIYKPSNILMSESGISAASATINGDCYLSNCTIDLNSNNSQQTPVYSWLNIAGNVTSDNVTIKTCLNNFESEMNFIYASSWDVITQGIIVVNEVGDSSTGSWDLIRTTNGLFGWIAPDPASFTLDQTDRVATLSRIVPPSPPPPITTDPVGTG